MNSELPAEGVGEVTCSRQGIVFAKSQRQERALEKGGER